MRTRILRVGAALAGIALSACSPRPAPDAARSHPDCFVEWNPGCPRGLDDTHEVTDCRWPGEKRRNELDTRPECVMPEGGLVLLVDGGFSAPLR